MKGLKWVVVLCVLAGLGAGGWFLFGRGAGDADGALAGPATEPVTRADIAVAAEASGVLEPVRVVEVKSKASGEALEVTAETGDVVEAGALLARIDPRDVENAYQQAAADLEAARVKARTAKAHQARMEALRKTAVITQQELEVAVETFATANAALVRAQTNLQLALERRRDVTIRAPITGTLIERHVEPGQIIASATSNVSGGSVLFKMADLSAMQVRARIDETDIGKIAPGQSVAVTVEAFPGRIFRGQVQKVEPQSVIEQNVTLFPVLVRLDNKGGLLRPGMNAEVTIEIDRRDDVLAIPNSAVVSMRDAAGAARMLGVDEETLRAVMRPGGGGRDGAGPGQGGRGEKRAAVAACADLPENAGREGGPILNETQQAKLAECREQLRAERGAGTEAGPGTGGAGVRGAGMAAAGTAGSPRPAVVFVKTGTGVAPKRVTLGLGDWDRTEVVTGLSEGDEVVLVAAAQLRANQQRMEERFRSRMGGGIPGAGGGGGGGRPRGGGR